MKILLVSPHFYPEDFKCNDVAFELAKRGYEVTVLSDIPNYPLGKFFDGYGVSKKRKEVVQGVTIHRVLVIPRGNGRAIRLALNYLSFAFFASVKAFFMALFHKYDAILVHETSPITVGIPALVVKKMQQIPLYFWVLDLWPESLSAAGGISNKRVLNFFANIAKWIYRNSQRILISSRGFEESIKEKGDFADKLVYFPNWADKALLEKKEYVLPDMPQKGLKVMFAGNMGEAQDFDHIMETASLLKEEKHIHFVFVGDGRKRPWIEQVIEEKGLQETVHWVGRHPLEAMPSFFEAADIMLVTLKDEPIFNLTAPAKIQAYMSAGKPIVAMMNGEGARIIEDAQCGYSAQAANAEKLAEIILKMDALGEKARNQMGENGKIYCKQHFDWEKCMNHLCEILEERQMISLSTDCSSTESDFS